MWLFDRESFRHAQKMEAMGRLTAGVAHDFYNILTVIQGYAALLARGQRTQKDINEQLSHISAAANRGAILTRQLLSYSRRDPLQFEPLDLSGLIDNLSNMLNRLLGEEVLFQTTCSAMVKPILGDRGMIEQLVVNLIVNARDAIAERGKIAIATDMIQITKTHVERHPKAKVGEFVCLSVCDTGCGMGEEILARMFEPFFTTKDPDKGTGLGLAMVLGIIEQHSGWIEVRSQVGVGTEFKVYFPCAPSIPAHKQRKPHATCISAGNETILVVEDEAQLRGLAAYTLKFHGYHVIEAEGPAQALALWPEKSSVVDLVLTDMVMPGTMSGGEMAEKLRHAKPGLKVVYTSGYSAVRAGQEPAIWGERNFVAKPYLPDALVQAVQDSLANRGQIPG